MQIRELIQRRKISKTVRIKMQSFGSSSETELYVAGLKYVILTIFVGMTFVPSLMNSSSRSDVAERDISSRKAAYTNMVCMVGSVSGLNSV
jgi:hypothetical protein